ncbi:hypothetical protein V8G54_035925 [Vigna mungo]|uniref:protein disulfide-isomerase n=1 Tax=Vigna mungo TaxID=3915 RepID=A0AAQ3MGB9_VIGMU
MARVAGDANEEEEFDGLRCVLLDEANSGNAMHESRDEDRADTSDEHDEDVQDFSPFNVFARHGFITNTERALEELFVGEENNYSGVACLNVIAKRIATVFCFFKRIVIAVLHATMMKRFEIAELVENLKALNSQVVATFNLDEEVVIANVDADKYKNLVEKYGVIGYPTLKFFPKSNKVDEDYSGGRSLDDFVAFINEKCGTYRDEKGQLSSKAGIVESLDGLVKEFVSANDNDKKTVYSQLEEEVKKLKGYAVRYDSLYLNLPRRVWKRVHYAKNEILRLDRMQRFT